VSESPSLSSAGLADEGTFAVMLARWFTYRPPSIRPHGAFHVVYFGATRGFPWLATGHSQDDFDLEGIVAQLDVSQAFTVALSVEASS
jgi:hypothetical protein